MFSFRKAAACPSLRAGTFVPLRVIVPLVGVSSAPSRYSIVLLPLPDGPMIAAASPGASVKLASFSTSTGPAAVS